jgi:hypothetical protein
VVLILFAAIIWGIAQAASSNRYAHMTEKEFEEEAKQTSGVGGMVTAFQKIVDPSHAVEYVQEEKQRAEADGAESGDTPRPGDSATLPAPHHKS